uniref:Uncharacterized mitochondrial protein AtMg00810-like n=1 Tax=Tanacetum cinerariifolium TaxID=118510 RepID=A0A6L2N707_TANCI|nr:uncharacterized mitochondrial protein AtMg00810-like [Tanacetum cinerariifolium]
MKNCDTVSTRMVEQAKLKLDLVGKPVDHTDYRSMIGSLMYVTSSRPNIMFATCMCARYQANSNEHHVSAVKRIFHYLKWTINLGLWYLKDSGFNLTAYSDAEYAGCHLDRKSTSGSVQFLGDKLVCWSFKKQNCLSISTAESEYVTVSGYCDQVLWMRTQLTDYGFFYDKVPIYCDSKSAIAISCNPVTRGLMQNRHGGGSDQGLLLPRSMRLDVLKFSMDDPERWIFAITEYFSLLNTPADQRLRTHIVKKKTDATVPLQSELASPKIKGSLNADEDIGVDEVVGGGEALGVGEDDDSGNAATNGGDDTVENGDISILNSLIGHESPRSLQLWGTIVYKEEKNEGCNAKKIMRFRNQDNFFRHHFEDKVVFEGVKSVTPVLPEDGRPKRPQREKSKPVWHKDYVI